MSDTLKHGKTNPPPRSPGYFISDINAPLPEAFGFEHCLPQDTLAALEHQWLNLSDTSDIHSDSEVNVLPETVIAGDGDSHAVSTQDAQEVSGSGHGTPDIGRYIDYQGVMRLLENVRVLSFVF
jgi:hypothetical protein